MTYIGHGKSVLNSEPSTGESWREVPLCQVDIDGLHTKCHLFLYYRLIV